VLDANRIAYVVDYFFCCGGGWGEGVIGGKVGPVGLCSQTKWAGHRQHVEAIHRLKTVGSSVITSNLSGNQIIPLIEAPNFGLGDPTHRHGSLDLI
jgi:hypothetical protein